METSEEQRRNPVDKRLETLPTDRLSPMRIAGFTLYCGWILAVFYSTFLYQSSADYREALYLNMFVSMVALTVTLVAFPHLVHNPDKWVLSKRVIAPATVGLVVATGVLCFADSGTAFGFGILIFSGVLTGICSGILFLGWFRIYSDAGTKTALIEVAGAWAIGALCCVVLYYLPAIASIVVLLAGTGVSGVLLRSSALRRPARPKPIRQHTLHPRTRHMFIRGLIACVSFGLVAGFSDVMSGFRLLPVPEHYGVYLMLGVSLIAFVALAIAVSAKHVATLYCYRLAFMAIALGCMATPFVEQISTISTVLIFGGYTCFQIALMVVCIDVSNYFDIRSTRSFGIAFAALYLGEIIGAGVAHMMTFASVGSVGLNLIAFLLLGAALFANLFLFTEKDLVETSVGEMTDGDVEPAPVAAPTAEDASEATVARLVERYGLTAREAELLPLIIKGRTIARMQEELFISQGTVSTHTRHIYQKIGVRNRQALLDLIDSLDED